MFAGIQAACQEEAEEHVQCCNWILDVCGYWECFPWTTEPLSLMEMSFLELAKRSSCWFN